MQRHRLDWSRGRAAQALDVAPEGLPDAIPETLNAEQGNAVRTLAASLHGLGQIQVETGETECVEAYEESLHLAEKIDDQAVAATCAFNLGHAYEEISTIRDLEQAEHWYRRSLDLHDENDRQGRAGCLAQLGHVAVKRFEDTRVADKPDEEVLHHLTEAAQYYHRALDLLPSNAVNDLAVAHNQLGNIYRSAGDLDRALHHWRESIRYTERADDVYRAAGTRFNVAVALAGAGRLADARDYARAVLRDYQTYGDRAAAKIQETQRLIERIEQALDDQES